MHTIMLKGPIETVLTSYLSRGIVCKAKKYFNKMVDLKYISCGFGFTNPVVIWFTFTDVSIYHCVPCTVGNKMRYDLMQLDEVCNKDWKKTKSTMYDEIPYF